MWCSIVVVVVDYVETWRAIVVIVIVETWRAIVVIVIVETRRATSLRTDGRTDERTRHQNSQNHHPPTTVCFR